MLQAEHDRNRKDAVNPMNKYVCGQGHVTITTGTISECPNCKKSVTKY